MRREFPAKVKVEAFKRAGGHCESCTAFLMPGKFAYDHILPDALGGEPVLSNIQVLCDACHDAKTHKADVPRISKMKRQQARHIGAKKSSRPMPGSKASGWKRKFNGTVERRT